MAISIKCHGCGKSVRAKDTSAGKRVKCPTCGTVLNVPDADGYADEVEEPAPSRHSAPVKAAKSGGSKGLVAAVVGLAGMVVAAGGFFWWTGRDAPVPEERPIAKATWKSRRLVTAPLIVLFPDPTFPPPQPRRRHPEQGEGRDRALDPAEVIAKITVTIHVGTGDDLEEPVALDLGLGYRSWLHPVGHKSESPPPRGDIPEQPTAKEKIAAGKRPYSAFTATETPEQDQFRASAQLLANTKVGDIARVGFASAGTTNWVLAGYDITINDKPFASGKPNVKAGERDAANKRLAELAAEMGPLQQVQNDMQQLLLANQLEEKDKTQLQEYDADEVDPPRSGEDLAGRSACREVPVVRGPGVQGAGGRQARGRLGESDAAHVHRQKRGHGERCLRPHRGPQVFHQLSGPAVDGPGGSRRFSSST